MQYKENSAIRYLHDEMFIEDISVKSIVEQTGTPVYIYSSSHFLGQVNKFKEAFAEIAPKVFFASKANFNTSVIRTFVEAGCGVDVNSAGELFRALHAGAQPENIIFAGVGKTDEEIAYAINTGIYLIKSESRDEVEVINRIAGEIGKKVRVALRVNPDVDPKTHPYISTSLANNKFGVSFQSAIEIMTCGQFANVIFSGIDMHLGSQITTTAPYLEAVEKIAGLVQELRKLGVEIHHLDLGGGFGVAYAPEDVDFQFGTLPAQLAQIIKPLQVEVFFEPGRYLTANGGILVTKVQYTKENGTKKFAIVDAAMTELMRPVLYSAYHHIQPIAKIAGEEQEYDVVGPVCESSDFLAKSRKLPLLKRGTLLSVCSAGSYAEVMSSNYNARLKPAGILVSGNSYKIVRRRETLPELLRLEDNNTVV